MKILFCHNYYQQRGGEDQVFEDESWLLRQNGHEVLDYQLSNDNIKGMNRIELIKKTFWNTEAAGDLRRIIQDFRPEVVHCINSFPLISPVIGHVVKDEGCVMVQTLQNYRLICPNAQLLRNEQVCEKCVGKRLAWPAVVHRCYREDIVASAVVAGMLSYHTWKKTWTNAVDRFIVPSQFTLEKYLAAGFDKERFSIKPNFLRPDPGVGDGQGDYAVFVGRLSPEKGILTLLDGWRKLLGDYPLKILGDGPLAPQVQQAAAGDARIQWLGRRSLPEVCRHLGHAKFSIVPSIWNEPFGRTVIESMAVGTPVLASRMGALPELIVEGKTGRFFNSGDATDFARVALELFCDDTLNTVMRSSARCEYLSNYTAETNYQQLMTIYHDTLQSQRSEETLPLR